MPDEVESIHVEMVTIERRSDGAVVRKHQQVKVLDPQQFSINEFRPDPHRGGKRVLVSLSGVLEGSHSEVLVDNTQLLPEDKTEK
jgi:hypothetical protein